MCFLIDNKHRRIKTAKEDIHCWKIVIPQYVGYEAQYFRFTYFFGVECKLEGKLKRKWEEGVARLYIGFHSYSTMNRAYRYNEPFTTVREFVIPKGSHYFYNETHEEYVSDAIKLVEE